MKKILLDTNAYSQFMAGNQEVFEIIGGSDAVYLSIFVLAELLYGFKFGRKQKENLHELKVFYSKPRVKIIEAGSETAEIYAGIKLELRKSGNPIPNNDIWIAAHAIETGSILVTNDAHFKHVRGMRKINF
ncbi:MAG: type II toxin-antitoxin system VapC family toxin [Spirochaetales bacterium]|nr:type II toxin-antitoxin system VapC family toxin [Spirochaetales bacterium]